MQKLFIILILSICTISYGQEPYSLFHSFESPADLNIKLEELTQKYGKTHNIISEVEVANQIGNKFDKTQTIKFYFYLLFIATPKD